MNYFEIIMGFLILLNIISILQSEADVKIQAVIGWIWCFILILK